MAAVDVTDEATRLDTVVEADSIQGSSISVYNNGAATVWLGRTDEVTAADGYPLGPGEHYAQDLGPGEELWGVTATGTVDVRTIETGIG